MASRGNDSIGDAPSTSSSTGARRKTGRTERTRRQQQQGERVGRLVINRTLEPKLSFNGGFYSSNRPLDEENSGAEAAVVTASLVTDVGSNDGASDAVPAKEPVRDFGQGEDVELNEARNMDCNVSAGVDVIYEDEASATNRPVSSSREERVPESNGRR
jgi:hypothetical protein